MENMAEMDDMAVKRVNAMKGLLPELPGGVPIDQEEAGCSSDASFSSKSSEMAAVATAEPGGSSAKHQASWDSHDDIPGDCTLQCLRSDFKRK
eukprot:symbB.v1.2.001021.t1/scaffold52.1/size380577/11